MKYRELTVLLPCHSIEDFPLHQAGDDADSLLVSWTALWHPVLVAAAESAPKWHRVDVPPEDFQDKLILVPRPSVAQLAAGFQQRVREAGGVLLMVDADRPSILSRIFADFDGGEGSIDSELTADFLALGYAFLQVQILTRQMRYSSNLDEVAFFNRFRTAASEAVQGNVEQARTLLAACFDQLAEERDHYYSVDAYLIDLTLVSDETTSAVEKELSSTSAVNFLLSGEIATAWKAKQPELWQRVMAAVQDGRVGLVGGENVERRLPLLSCEGVLAAMREGKQSYESALGRGVEVFGRRKFGLTPVLPGILEKLKFRGALHATMDDGRFPSGAQSKTRWQGIDSGVIDAITKPPLDASQPDMFLSYAQKLGDSMDRDHVATLCLAHWAGHTSPWYQDLKRCTRFTSALGKFITIDRYFADTYLPGHLDRFAADQYQSPYLRQDVIRKRVDPISSVMRSWQSRVASDAAQALATLAAAAGNVSQPWPSDESHHVECESDDRESRLVELNRQCAAFANVLPRQSVTPVAGCLVFNPSSIVRRIGVDVTEFPELPNVEKPLYAADANDGRKHAIVDVPPMGFAWLGPGGRATRSRKNDPPLAQDARERDGVLWLRNEFIEISIDPVTGAIPTVKDYQSRGNRLSQQLALRMPGELGQPGESWRDPDELAVYSVMAADEVKVLTGSSAFGEIEARGRLLDKTGQILAAFRQTFRLWRGSRVVELDIELEPRTVPGSDPWNSYYASRFAWSDETANLFCSVNQTRQPTTKGRIESPLYVEVAAGEQRTAILTGGLPYHRRVGSRMLDSLLVVRGETARTFRMGIGLEVNQVLPAAIGLIEPPLVLREVAAPPSPTHSWLFHLDARSVVATHWSAIVEGGRLIGVRARLLESAGRGLRARLSAFRSFVAARQVNFVGETVSELTITDGKVVLDMAGHEWIEVEARWS